MLKVIRNEKQAYSAINGTFRVGEISADYMGLELALGEPTFDTESPDGKVQVEWIVKFKDDYGGVNLFTIYDWKFYSRDHIIFPDTMVNWHVGGKSPAYDLIDYLEKRI